MELSFAPAVPSAFFQGGFLSVRTRTACSRGSFLQFSSFGCVCLLAPSFICHATGSVFLYYWSTYTAPTKDLRTNERTEWLLSYFLPRSVLSTHLEEKTTLNDGPIHTAYLHARWFLVGLLVLFCSFMLDTAYNTRIRYCVSSGMSATKILF